MKIAYIFNHSSFFVSHFLPIASVANKKYYIKLFCGNDASKITGKKYLYDLKKKKISFEKFKFSATSFNLFLELRAFYNIYIRIKKYKPDIIHCASPKGILIGGILAILINVRALVIFNSGMGFLANRSKSIKINFFCFIYFFIFKNIILKHKKKKIIIENKTDYFFFRKKFNLNKNEILLINGSGVDLSKYKYSYKESNTTISFLGRVVKEKGVYEFCEASKVLKKKFSEWKFNIIGPIDYSKDSSLKLSEISRLQKDTGVNFLGFKKNVLPYLKKTSIVCLPSYREGLSKVLLEAAAMGIPVVTTNTVGCKDAIIPNKTGLLCNVGDSKSLIKKLIFLIKKKRLRRIMGINGYKLAKKKYNINLTIKKNLAVYEELIK